MNPNSHNLRKEEERYWNREGKSGKSLDLKYSRGLPDDTPDFKVVDYRGFDYRPIQENVLLRAPKWLRVLLNPSFVQERLTRLIETGVVPVLPSLSFLGHRLYVKCLRQ